MLRLYRGRCVLQILQLQNLAERKASQQCLKQVSHIKQCYAILRVSNDCSDAELKESYLSLAKIYHPDTTTDKSSVDKFTELDLAYKKIIQHRQEIELADSLHSQIVEDDEKIFDIKHTAPQHRQYLSHEGIGFGTPHERSKHYDLYKVQKASENINEYQVQKITSKYETTMVAKDKKRARKVVIRNAIDRLVEDLISESMSKGEFDDLPGKGKPLKHTVHNPMIDTTTHNINKILINNGYVPEWINLEKEIKTGIIEHRERLLQKRLQLGTDIFPQICKELWERNLIAFADHVKVINSQIDKFNLTVPCYWQQMVHYDVNREIKKVLDLYHEKVEKGEAPVHSIIEKSNGTVHFKKRNFVGILDGISLKEVIKEIKAVFTSK